MPTYEYKCLRCGQKFEMHHAFFSGRKEKEVCPKCGSVDAERVYSSLFSSNNTATSCDKPPAARYG
jgi:putative FmdB family regulatory protein